MTECWAAGESPAGPQALTAGLGAICWGMSSQGRRFVPRLLLLLLLEAPELSHGEAARAAATGGEVFISSIVWSFVW